MYFVFLFLASWVVFLFFADKERLRELYGALVFTSFLGLLTDLIMVHYRLWDYHGLPHPMFVIPLTLDFGIYPVVSYLYLQYLPKKWGAILRFGLYFSIGATLLEWLTLATGHMHHHMWWNLFYSFLSDNAIFTMMTSVYLFYGSAYGGRTERIRE